MTKDDLQKAVASAGCNLQDPGCVLLSPASTVKPGELLWVGFNPGGDPSSKCGGTTIAQALDADDAWFRTGRDSDTQWANRSARQMQFAMRLFADLNGCSVEEVCALNLVFRRTVKAAEIDASELDACCSVVEMVIHTVRPARIVCNGRATFAALANRLHATGQSRYPGAGRWFISRVSVVISGRSALLLGFPHFSRWSLRRRESEVCAVWHVA